MGDKPKVVMKRRQVVVQRLFDGKLGVKLKGGMHVVGFDHPEAKEFGWQLNDEIIAVNGRPIKDRESFANEYMEAKKSLPIVFTVLRQEKVKKKNSSLNALPNPKVLVQETLTVMKNDALSVGKAAAGAVKKVAVA